MYCSLKLCFATFSLPVVRFVKYDEAYLCLINAGPQINYAGSIWSSFKVAGSTSALMDRYYQPYIS